MKFIIHKINIKFLIIYYIYISIGSLLNAQEKSYLAPDVNIISVTLFKAQVWIWIGFLEKFRPLI